MADIPIKRITPDEVDNSQTGPFPFEQFARKMLAQGDSWFSIGHLPPGTTTNLLLDMALPWRTVVVDCARPGRLLSRMTDTTRDRKFLRLLKGKFAHRWDAILLSGGGNDLIEALQSPPSAEPSRRLLATIDEWGDAALGAKRYVSEPGWATFADHIGTVFAIFQAAKQGGVNDATPVFLHDYDQPTPRNAGSGLGGKPWLMPALQTFGVPRDDWPALSSEMMGRLSALLHGLTTQHAHVHVVPTLGTLVPADSADDGATADWQNEIHPTRDGYLKLDAVWRDALQAVLGNP